MPDNDPNLNRPLTRLLSRQPFPELAAALRARIESIVRSWLTSVQQTLPKADQLTFEQLRDHLPDVLQLLADALACADSHEADKLLNVSPVHGETRYHDGYSEQELLIEYWLLRRIVVEEVQIQLDRRLTTPESHALHLGLDVAVQKAVLEYSRHHEQQLRAAAAAEGKFLAFLSHDLRNSLNTVSLTLQILRHQLAGKSEYAESVQDIDAVHTSMNSTIAGMERLLQWEKLRKGGGGPNISRVDLHSLVEGIVREVSVKAEGKDVRIVNEVTQGESIDSDKDLLSLILQNLVGNAVKFSSKGAVRITSSDGCSLSVSDEGPGIARDRLATIFETFRRGETHGKPGVGLGLAIASQAARMLGVELNVTSEVGVGSTFCLTLPRTTA